MIIAITILKSQLKDLTRGWNDVMGFRKLIKIYFRSMLISLSILSLWMICEYQQFGELQFNRQCDDMVFILYHSVITWLLVDVERLKELREKNEI